MRGLAALLGGALVLCGCTAKAPEPHPRVRGLELSSGEVSNIVAELDRRDRALPAFKALARASIVHRAERTRIRQIFVLERAKLRVENLPLGAAYAASLLVVNGVRLTFIDQTARRAVLGFAGRDAMQRFLGVPLEVAEVRSLIAGCVPHALLSSTDWLGYRDSEGGSIALVARNRRRYLFLDARSLELQSIELRSAFDDSVVLRMVFSDFKQVESTQLPRQLRISVPPREIEIELGFSAISLDNRHDEKLFEVAIPADYEITIVAAPKKVGEER